jgi:hypothetical protein
MVNALLNKADLIELPRALEDQLVEALKIPAAGQGSVQIPEKVKEALSKFLKPLVDMTAPVVVPAGHTGLVIPVELQKIILGVTGAG